MHNTKTFAGLPACMDIDDLSADIAIIGIPHGTLCHPRKPSHSAQASTSIRKVTQKYASMLDHYDFDLGGPLLDNRKIRKRGARKWGQKDIELNSGRNSLFGHNRLL